MSYIEPCCCDRQMPALVKSHKTAFFQTAGDVTVQKMMKAVSHLAGSQMEMVLVADAVDIKLLRYIKQYFTKGWITSLLLLTLEDQQALVAAEMKGLAVTYAQDETICDGMLAFVPAMDGGSQFSILNSQFSTVIIHGRMLLKVEPGFCQYAMYSGTNGDIIDGALAAVRSKIKVTQISQITQKKATATPEPTTEATTTDSTDETDAPETLNLKPKTKE